MAPAPKKVVITGVLIRFFAMLWLILNWSLAAIPSISLLWVVGLTFTLTVGLSTTAIAAAIGAAATQAR